MEPNENQIVKTEVQKVNPFNTMVNNVAKLIDVKTIITLSVIWAVIWLAHDGKINPDSLKDMGLMIVGYFFGTKKSEQKSNG